MKLLLNILNHCLLLPLLFCNLNASAQNSLTGDGFGGRLWYKAYNYTVGSYSGYTVCGDSAQLYGWGVNRHYELGDGTNINTANPVKAMGMTNVHYYSTGYNMGAIKKDSSGWVWGSPISLRPIKILNNVKFLDAGAVMCSFVKYDGTVWTVGVNSSGAFGNDSVNPSPTSYPRKASGINTAVRVAVARSNLAILLADGTVMTTGSNGNGMLGNASPLNTIARQAVQVPNLKKIVDIKATTGNFAALDSFGNVYTWGSSTAIGNGTTMLDTPTMVPTLSNIVAISGCEDGYNFLALDKDHIAYGWGPNYGVLGTGNTTQYRHTTVQVATDVSDIMCGETFSYIVKTNGTLWGTGRSNGGSIWMNLKDSSRVSYTQIDPTIAPLNLCELPPFSGNYFRVKTIPCVYDSLTFEVAPNDSFTDFHWNFGDGSTQVYATKIKHKFAAAGTYNIMLLALKKSDNRKDTTFRILRVNDATYAQLFNGDTSICGRVAYNKTPLNYDEESSYRWQNNSTDFTTYINNPGLYILEATDANGCHYKDSFNVIQHDVPKALYSADNYSICANSKDSIRFTNTSVSKDSLVRCRWDFFEDTLSSTGKTVAFKFKKPGTIAVWLSVWTKYGCTNDTIDVFDILPAPKPVFSLVVNDSCLNGNSISLENKTLKDTINTPRFKWFFSEGFALSNRNPTVPRSYTDTGRYYIDLIYVNNNNCTDTMRKFVHIYGHPEPDFSMQNPACSRDSIPFVYTGSSSNPLKAFNWNFGDGTSGSNLQSPKHRFPGKGLYQITLVSTSVYGCKDSISRLLRVHNPPRAGFSINDSIQCLLGNTFVFASTSSADSGSLVVYEWKYGDLNQDTGKNPSSKSFGNTGQYTVLHLVEDLNGCRDTITRLVEVKNGPVVDFTINDAGQCENRQDFIFNYTPWPGNDSIENTEWRLNGAGFGDSQTLRYGAFTTGNHRAELILKTRFGCPGLNSKLITVHAVPQAKFTVNSDTQCFIGHNFSFSNLSSISNGNIRNFDWNWGDNSDWNGHSPGLKRYSQYGTYQVTLSVESDSGCMAADSMMLKLQPNPQVRALPVAPVCQGNQSIFNAAGQIEEGRIILFEWDFGDRSQDTGIRAIHTYRTPGLYPVTLRAISSEGCMTDSVFPGHASVHELPYARFDYSILEGDKNNHLYQFRNRTTPTPAYTFWSFGPYGNALKDSSISVTDTFTIPVTLIVRNLFGCSDTTASRVFASGPLQVYMPDAFTPGDDGINDAYMPGGILNVQSYLFEVYNRWGQLLFQSHTPGLGWNGKYQNKDAPQDVYVYRIQLTGTNGKPKIYRGTFTLLR